MSKTIKILKETDICYYNLSVSDVEKFYTFTIGVEVVPYEGTIRKKFIEKIVNNSNGEEITESQLAVELAEKLECKNTLYSEVKLSLYAKWAIPSAPSWENKLLTGVEDIRLCVCSS